MAHDDNPPFDPARYLKGPRYVWRYRCGTVAAGIYIADFESSASAAAAIRTQHGAAVT